ncbi:MAG TPA: arylamine N-acetyltransferase [Steroidobacteraceae bacterium]|jgi:N-hydroxyarylamine O-acetyltransferase|nr:arylamine N-acetyltransferase [Steroidobacteraceae bacterium]
MNSIDQKSPRLAAYLERIGFNGTARPDLETLRELQRAHVRAVPFENLDVQLHRPVRLDLDTCYDKIVRQRRGGWCFELNGLLGWALREIGFDVVRTSAGVMREHVGDVQMGNHLCLLVRLGRPYLVDVGFGGSLSYPLPLEASGHDHSPYQLTLTDMGDGYWRFSERAHGGPFSFDFFIGAADEARFAEKCAMLQTNPESPFVQNLVVQRRMRDTHISLRGRVLTTLHAAGEDKIHLASAEGLVSALQEKFDLNVPEAATLWPAICARHEAVFKDS